MSRYDCFVVLLAAPASFLLVLLAARMARGSLHRSAHQRETKRVGVPALTAERSRDTDCKAHANTVKQN